MKLSVAVYKKGQSNQDDTLSFSKSVNGIEDLGEEVKRTVTHWTNEDFKDVEYVNFKVLRDDDTVLASNIYVRHEKIGVLVDLSTPINIFLDQIYNMSKMQMLNPNIGQVTESGIIV